MSEFPPHRPSDAIDPHALEADESSFNAPSKTVEINPIERLKRAYSLIEKQYWLFFAIVFVAMLIGGAVPFGILLGPMLCGVFLCYRARTRNQEVKFETLFKGFDYFAESLKPVLIAAAIITVVSMIVYGFLFVVFFVFLSATAGAENPLFGIVVFPMIFVFTLIMGVLTALIYTPLTFAIPLIVERKMNGLEAAKLSLATSKPMFFEIFKMYVVFNVIGIIAAALCVIPAYLFAPIAIVASFSLYDDVFASQSSS